MPSRVSRTKSHTNLTTIRGGITAPQGFLASGISAGIKERGRLDLCMIFSQAEASAAGAFTRNRVAAAPVLWTRRILHRPTLRAVLANSGNANACTGAEGLENAKIMAERAAAELSVEAQDVAVASTGVIGLPLPMDRILPAIPGLAKGLSRSGGEQAAQAILTTDTVTKVRALEWTVRNQPVRMGGIAKGSGMIHPNMATMLAFVTTDAAVDPGTLHTALRDAVEASFNRITVDGDTSTNDMVLILANGLSGARINRKNVNTSGFQEALNRVCLDLARAIVRDGEGATKFVAIRILHGQSMKGCLTIAKKVACSSLVKTALFGEDANWGRIMAAVGASGVPIRENWIDILLDDLPLVREGIGLGPEQEKAVARILKKKEFTVTIDLHLGTCSAEVYTSDLSLDYIKINADYRS